MGPEGALAAGMNVAFDPPVWQPSVDSDAASTHRSQRLAVRIDFPFDVGRLFIRVIATIPTHADPNRIEPSSYSTEKLVRLIHMSCRQKKRCENARRSLEFPSRPIRVMLALSAGIRF